MLHLTAFELLLIISQMEHIIKDQFVGEFKEPIKITLLRLHIEYDSRSLEEKQNAIAEHEQLIILTEQKHKV